MEGKSSGRDEDGKLRQCAHAPVERDSENR